MLSCFFLPHMQDCILGVWRTLKARWLLLLRLWMRQHRCVQTHYKCLCVCFECVINVRVFVPMCVCVCLYFGSYFWHCACHRRGHPQPLITFQEGVSPTPTWKVISGRGCFGLCTCVCVCFVCMCLQCMYVLVANVPSATDNSPGCKQLSMLQPWEFSVAEGAYVCVCALAINQSSTTTANAQHLIFIMPFSHSLHRIWRSKHRPSTKPANNNDQQQSACKSDSLLVRVCRIWRSKHRPSKDLHRSRGCTTGCVIYLCEFDLCVSVISYLFIELLCGSHSAFLKCDGVCASIDLSAFSPVWRKSRTMDRHLHTRALCICGAILLCF